MTSPFKATLTTLSVPQWRAFERTGRDALDAAIGQGVATREQLRRDRHFLTSDCNLGHFYKATYFALIAEGTPVSLNVSYLGKQSRGHWGRYLTVHFAYTLYGMRGRGYGGALLRKVEECARADGIKRLRGLPNSYGGFRLHLAAQHPFWGPEGNGLRIDAPVAPWQGPISFPQGIPHGARSCGLTRPANAAQLLAWVTAPQGSFRGADAPTRAAMRRHGICVP